MILNPTKIEALSRQREGQLEQTPFAVLLHALAVHERTVVLEIERKPLSKQIIFEGGVPVDCRSNLVHETFGRFLVSKGMLNEEAFQRTLNQSAAQGVPQGEVLVQEGLIQAYDLYRLLQQNLAKKLLDGFTWRSGDYRLLFDMPEVESPLKVKVPQLVVTGACRFASQEEINNGVGELVGRSLVRHPAPHFRLEDIRFTAPQAKVVESLAKPSRLDQLASASGLPFDELTRLVYALIVIGTVLPEDAVTQEMREVARKRAELAALETPEEGGAAVPVLSEAEVEKRRNEVMKTFLAHRRQDAFDLLGLEEDAGGDAIREAYVKFARRFAPWGFAGAQLAALAEKSEDLFLAGAGAYAELADAERRNSLVARRRERRAEAAKPKTAARDAFKIKTELLDPEVQYKKGRALMAQGDYLEALKLLDFAVDCDPQNGVYRAEATYCRFLYAPAANGKKCIQELQETLRIDPKCGLAMYYLGVLLAETGTFDKAELVLQQAAKHLNGDDRPQQLLAELPERQKKWRR